MNVLKRKYRHPANTFPLRIKCGREILALERLIRTTPPPTPAYHGALTDYKEVLKWWLK